jgi:NAD(P)-dependent dehydrogenase (short-subunit alcohol dehydrogenase family)
MGGLDAVVNVALRRKGAPSKSASWHAFLISDAAYMTGQAVTVDGGRSA